MTRPTYVFDLDGVITDPAHSQVNETVVDGMRQLLIDGQYVAINTGRSFAWVEENLLRRLMNNGSDTLFQRFIVVCEKGGETVRWQQGEWRVYASQFALSPEVYRRIKAVFNRLSDRLPTMFWDATKRTMATVEKHPHADLATFHTERETLIEAWKNECGDARIDGTTIATDVESPLAGKQAGAALIHAWAIELIGEGGAYICFGDSSSDYEMARYFADQGADTTFVYVGVPTDTIVLHDKVTFITTTARYAAGTREYFAHYG